MRGSTAESRPAYWVYMLETAEDAEELEYARAHVAHQLAKLPRWLFCQVIERFPDSTVPPPTTRVQATGTGRLAAVHIARALKGETGLTACGTRISAWQEPTWLPESATVTCGRCVKHKEVRWPGATTATSRAGRYIRPPGGTLPMAGTSASLASGLSIRTRIAAHAVARTRSFPAPPARPRSRVRRGPGGVTACGGFPQVGGCLTACLTGLLTAGAAGSPTGSLRAWTGVDAPRRRRAADRPKLTRVDGYRHPGHPRSA